MALSKEAAKDAELPEEVVGEIEAAEGGQDAGGEDEGEQQVTVRLSRRKKEQQEREERMAALESDRTARAQEAERLRQELAQTREAQARMQGILEQMQRMPAGRESGREEAPVDLRDKLDELRRTANDQLGKQDLDAWQRTQEAIMDAKAEMKARAIVAAQQKNMPAPQQQAPQKPDWVRAIEFQYPDVLTDPRGQHTVGIFDSLLGQTEQFGPQRLHKAFQRARTELGLAQAPAASNQARQLHTGISSNGVGRKPANGDSVVNMPRHYLETALKSGMTRAEAAKAWRESYPNEA